jgi:tetratricopeptide (TPR) repeat protein
VFWVHASNAARFEQSYRDIARSVKVPGWQSPTADIFQLVHDWLRDEKKGKWVLILDNVDDVGFLLEPRSGGHDKPMTSSDGKSSQPLVTFIPRCQNGSVLITTRSRNAALQLVEQRDMIIVEPMEKEDALALLQKKLWQQDSGNEEVIEEVIELAAALEFMPLAMVQAAAYISQRRPRCSVQQYLRDFRKSDRKRSSLLDVEGGRLRRDWEAKNSILITWQLSFDHVCQVRPSAADLLSLMSFCDRQGIPETLLRNPAKDEGTHQGEDDGDSHHADWGKEDDSSEDDDSSVSSRLEVDILMLRDYFLISVNADGITFEMHELVQLSMRKWLKVHGQLETWRQRFLSSLRAVIPIGAHENWVVCQRLFPHAKSAAAKRPEDRESIEDWAFILDRAAGYASKIGNWAEAETMSTQAMKARKMILGLDHEDTIWSIIAVGEVYLLQGRWDIAKELCLQVMETSKNKLGLDHHATLTVMSNLASALWNLGQWDAAEELQVKVMETRKMQLGTDDLETLISITNLASTYHRQGRRDAAENLTVQVLETSKKKLGVDHPHTLITMANLASIYWNQDLLDASEELSVQALEMSKKKLGVDHPDTLRSMANLASTYLDQGRWDASEELSVQVLEMRKIRLGVDHPDTMTSMNNLAWIWKEQGRDMEAICLMRESVRLAKQRLGVSHPDYIFFLEILEKWDTE